MSFVPDPLHPAVVHFPVVLIVLGCAAAWMAVFVRKGNAPWFAAVLLVLGAAGAWAAKETGKSDGGLLANMSPKMESLLDAHQNWAERTVMAATITALVAVAAAALSRFPKLARSMAVAAALAASVAGWTVYETGHRGGALVFEHGAGVRIAVETGSPANEDQSPLPAAQPQPDQEAAD
jgi:uncharacterized membrane protein